MYKRQVYVFLSNRLCPNVWNTKLGDMNIRREIITPYNVDILGDLIDELENNGMYF